jgi:Concanavalin A-like lectin/glucanases superfamily
MKAHPIRIAALVLTLLLCAGSAMASGSSYPNAIAASKPIAYYHLAETSGTTAHTVSGSYNGTYMTSPNLGQSGLVHNSNQAPSFSGNDRVVANSLSSRTNWPGLTLEAWVLVTQNTQEEHILVFSTWDGNQLPAILHDQPSKKFKYRDGSNTAYSTTIPQVGKVYYVVATIDNSNHGTLYVNGQAQDHFTSNRRPASNGMFTIGADYDCHSCNGNPVVDTYWHGKIDEAAVYDRALSQSEVTAHYQAGL